MATLIPIPYAQFNVDVHGLHITISSMHTSLDAELRSLLHRAWLDCPDDTYHYDQRKRFFVAAFSVCPADYAHFEYNGKRASPEDTEQKLSDLLGYRAMWPCTVQLVLDAPPLRRSKRLQRF
jgi:hypothetical protein